ncbi:MAG: RNA methyltransferase [Flammeovirgaceae bacterium]|nr:MAG: RNA methyltransferase [Flammeovirgaceae bacterium]
MLSRARIKFIKSLQLKKYRKQEQCFVVEGAKGVQEVLLSDFKVELLLATLQFLDENRKLTAGFTGELLEVSVDDLQGLGEYKTNHLALAVVRMREMKAPILKQGRFYLVLDDIRDPGNLGTILRIADWYGITDIIASSETAEVYNSKVIAASMGSFTRVTVFYTNLVEYLRKVNMPVLGTFLTGENIHHISKLNGGFIVIGNEANGISKEVETLVTRRITIPRCGKAESLNAAVATAVVCDNLVRLSGY